jgi:hypothetical protein
VPQGCPTETLADYRLLMKDLGHRPSEGTLDELELGGERA